MNRPDAKLILQELNRISNGKLKTRDDLEKLIETAIASNQMKLLEEISFDAKFIDGLLGVIKKKDDAIDPDYFVKAAGEYKEAVTRIISKLNLLISSSSDFYKSIFMEKFFTMSQNSLQNLNLLCEDLNYLKLFFNDQKYSGNKS